MSFDEDEKEIPRSKVGIKLNKSGSIFAKIPKKPSPQEFEKKADESNDRQEDYKTRGADLAVKYKSVLQDKTLSQNKTSIVLEIEQKVLQDLVALAQEMNVDQDETEGQGSLAVSAIALKCILLQRDKINNLDFKLEKMEKELKSLVKNTNSSLNNEKEENK